MWQIFLGSVLLSTIHALIPNHWIPLITISKTEKWSKNETLFATFITGFSHTLSTIIIGIIVGFAGYKLSEVYQLISRIAAPLILFIIGIVYIILDLRHAHHHHHHEAIQIERDPRVRKSKTAILTSLSIAMFLTPCFEIEAYYFIAGTIGWWGIFIVSAVYMSITLLIMFSLVSLGYHGIQKFNVHYLEHHERQVTGIVLIILAILAYFVEF